MHWQRPVVVTVETQRGEMLAQTRRGLRETFRPPALVVGGTGQPLHMGALAMQGAQADFDAGGEFGRVADQAAGIETQLGLVVWVPGMPEGPPLFQLQDRIGGHRGSAHPGQQSLPGMLRLQARAPTGVEGQAEGVVDQTVVQLLGQTLQGLPARRLDQVFAEADQQLRRPADRLAPRAGTLQPDRAAQVPAVHPPRHQVLGPQPGTVAPHQGGGAGFVRLEVGFDQPLSEHGLQQALQAACPRGRQGRAQLGEIDARVLKGRGGERLLPAQLQAFFLDKRR